ncbi:hypothetical protein AB0D66_22180 [Streptomyces sp. NPDC048270]|uniref:hypothetical protein n=1 Tax=Streptomyces sp. NPDC048270 TaxID=3154615 RepID=UPI0033DF8344
MATSTHSEIGRVGLALVAGSAAVAVLAGCTSGSAEKKPAPPISASPSASTDPQAAAKAEVAAAYRGYWDAQVKAFAKADVRDTGLEKYAFDQAYARALSDVATMKVNGSVMKGEPSLNPEVTAVSLEETPRKASITDCVDVTNWKVVDPKTGTELPLPAERLKRFVTRFEARTVGDEWKIVTVDQQDRAC